MKAPSHPVQAAQVLDQVLVRGGVVVDDGVLLVHAARLRRKSVTKSEGGGGGGATGRLTCSMSSQSSRPTKIISLGRRWRAPEPLTRNHDVTLILSGATHSGVGETASASAPPTPHVCLPRRRLTDEPLLRAWQAGRQAAPGRPPLAASSTPQPGPAALTSDRRDAERGPSSPRRGQERQCVGREAAGADDENDDGPRSIRPRPGPAAEPEPEQTPPVPPCQVATWKPHAGNAHPAAFTMARGGGAFSSRVDGRRASKTTSVHANGEDARCEINGHFLLSRVTDLIAGVAFILKAP